MPANFERRVEDLDPDCCSEAANASGNPVAEKMAKMAVEAVHRKIMEGKTKDAQENASEDKK